MQKRKNSGPVTTVTVFVCLCIHGEYEERYVSSDTINMIRKNKLLKDMLYCYYPDVFQKEAFFACDVINFLISLCHSSYHLGFMLFFKNLQSYLVCIWLKHR